VTIEGSLDTFEVTGDVAISNVLVRLEVTEYAGYRRFSGFFQASLDVESSSSSSSSSSSGFLLAATVTFEATLPMTKPLPPSDAPPTCATSTAWDVFPNQNLTGVGGGAALTAALHGGGFGGDTDGFYQRRGCGLTKVSAYAYQCGRTLVDMKAACAAMAACVGFTRLDPTADDAYATGCGFTVLQDTTMRHCEARYHHTVSSLVSR
jgi:hypothetical protein